MAGAFFRRHTGQWWAGWIPRPPPNGSATHEGIQYRDQTNDAHPTCALFLPHVVRDSALQRRLGKLAPAQLLALLHRFCRFFRFHRGLLSTQGRSHSRKSLCLFASCCISYTATFPPNAIGVRRAELPFSLVAIRASQPERVPFGRAKPWGNFHPLGAIPTPVLEIGNSKLEERRCCHLVENEFRVSNFDFRSLASAVQMVRGGACGTDTSSCLC